MDKEMEDGYWFVRENEHSWWRLVFVKEGIAESEWMSGKWKLEVSRYEMAGPLNPDNELVVKALQDHMWRLTVKDVTKEMLGGAK